MAVRAGTAVPDGWRAVRLGELADVNCDQWDPADGNPILYLDLTAVASPGRLSPPKELAADDAPSRARRRVQSGDILVSTVRPYLRGFARVAQAPANLIASTGFAVLTPRPEVDGSVLYHHVMAPAFASHLEGSMTGQAYPAVRPDDVAAYSLLLPSLPEQRAIAATEGLRDASSTNSSRAASPATTPPGATSPASAPSPPAGRRCVWGMWGVGSLGGRQRRHVPTIGLGTSRGLARKT